MGAVKSQQRNEQWLNGGWDAFGNETENPFKKTSMNKIDYWLEALEFSLEEQDISLPREMRVKIARDLTVAYENIGTAFNIPITSGGDSEVEKLRKELYDERRKVLCNRCNGSSIDKYYGGSCARCNGEGSVLPENQEIKYD